MFNPMLDSSCVLLLTVVVKCAPQYFQYVIPRPLVQKEAEVHNSNRDYRPSAGSRLCLNSAQLPHT